VGKSPQFAHNAYNGVGDGWDVVQVTVPADDIQEKTTDERGRCYLGPEYADATVEIAIVEVLDDV
jgi:hypothetical protein